MPTTPKGIITPNASDDYDLVVDLAAMANSTDTAISNSITAATLSGTQITSGTVAAARLPNLENLNGTLDIGSGGTGATTVTGAQTNLKIAVLQIVSTTKTDSFSTTSQSFVDVPGLSVSVTPTSNTNKVLVRVSGVAGGNNTSYVPLMRLMRGSTPIGLNSAGTWTGYIFNANSTNYGNGFTWEFLDSPATTSAVTYKMQLSTSNSLGTAFLGVLPSGGGVNAITTIVAEEIKA